MLLERGGVQLSGTVLDASGGTIAGAVLTAQAEEGLPLSIAHSGDAGEFTLMVPAEAPIVLQKMANSGRFDALVVLGAVVRGETYHFEVVANESASGITSVTLDTGVPIANGVLTTDDEDQALARMSQKGAECALAAIEMANLLRQLDED